LDGLAQYLDGCGGLAQIAALEIGLCISRQFG
jgi:hypothetical protein